VRRQPSSPDAWYNLGAILGVRGRAREALDAWRTRQTLVPGSLPDDGLERAFIAIRTGNFAEADRLLTEEALWRQLISLRTQGRLGEALAVAIRYHEEFENGLPMAQVLFESGRAAEAARMFERHATRSGQALGVRPDSVPGLYARTLVWPLTHAAAAYVAAGDTANLARLADTVTVLGAHSAYGRDRVLHHHLRGLQLLARGEREAAAAAFRRAIYSPTIGYTRTNLELARVLVALGRPRDAATVLAPALRGDLQASNYYVTHAELHEALAEALEAAGDADSARVHYAWVARAWSRGDPEFRERAERARVRAR
jgi:tetratricopeptide (TPR) repeat protein